MQKYAAFEILSSVLVPEHANRAARRKIAHRHEFDYTPRAGMLYVRSRAISSRCNDNFDEFPADEIAKGYKSFIGKPVFVNHVNDNHRNARGVIIDAALHRDKNPDGTPDTWAEVLMEVDAKAYPKLAQAILKKQIERTSMGTDVDYSICSICGNKATSPTEYCTHIPALKGKRIYRTTASGRKEGVLVREICYGLRFFENSLLVEPPADPTAYLTGVDDRGLHMSAKNDPALPKPEGLDLDGVALSKDDEGYYVRTHRARSKSYDSAEAIPAKVVKEIEATGSLFQHFAAADFGAYDVKQHKALHENGGFTAHPKGRPLPNEGYVASFEGHEKVIPMESVTPSDVAAHRKEVAPLLAQPGTYHGGWVDGGKAYLDVSKHFPAGHEADAKTFAEEQHQKAYYDIANEQSIPVTKTSKTAERIDLGEGFGDMARSIKNDRDTDNEMRDHADRRTVNLADPTDLKQHMMEAHDLDHSDFWRNSHPSDHPALGPASGDDRPLSHKEVRALHDHDHATAPGDYGHGHTLGDSHFHTAALSTERLAKASSVLRAGSWGRGAEPVHPDIQDNLDRYGVHHAALGRAGGAVRFMGVDLDPATFKAKEKNAERRTAALWTPPAPGVTPNAQIRHGADAYVARMGLPRIDHDAVSKINTDPHTVKAVAKAYDGLKANDPEAHASYHAMRKDVHAQYDHLTNRMGIKVEPVDHDPYKDAHEMAHDLHTNKRLQVMKTSTTGSHPFFSDDDNDKFRAVHDAFGHAATGRSFDRHGEEAAWAAHSHMFSPEAHGAMSTETRGQNASLITNGKFPEQKIGVLPAHLRDHTARMGKTSALEVAIDQGVCPDCHHARIRHFNSGGDVMQCGKCSCSQKIQSEGARKPVRRDPMSGIEMCHKKVDGLRDVCKYLLGHAQDCAADLNSIYGRDHDDMDKTSALFEHFAAGPKYPNPADHPVYKGLDEQGFGHHNIVDHYDQATDEEKKQGARWYEDGHHVASAIAGGDSHKGAGVLSAYSPQTSWPANMFNASRSFHQGHAVGIGEGINVMGMHHKSAQRVMDGEDHQKVLGGPKTQDFAHLLEHGGHDPQEENKPDYRKRVVIDRHALSVAAGRRLTAGEHADASKVLGSRHYYEHTADQYRKASDFLKGEGEKDVEPHQLQATTWLVRKRLNAAESDKADKRTHDDLGEAFDQGSHMQMLRNKREQADSNKVQRHFKERGIDLGEDNMHTSSAKTALTPMGTGKSDSAKHTGRETSDCSSCGSKIYRVKDGGPTNLEWQHDIDSGAGIPHQAFPSKAAKLAYGEVKAPSEVDTLRDEECPVCADDDAFDGTECQVCGYIAPPKMFQDPDTSIAQQMNLRQDQMDPAQQDANGGMAGEVPGSDVDGSDNTLAPDEVDEDGNPIDQVGEGVQVPGAGDPNAPVDEDGIVQGDVRGLDDVGADGTLDPSQIGPNGEMLVDPEAATGHVNQGGEPFTPGPNVPNGPGEPEGPGAVEEGDGFPGTPGDETPDLGCPACGFEVGGAHPTSVNTDDPMGPQDAGDGALEGDVCPNCQKALLGPLA